MASLNLSFKEWPFLTINQLPCKSLLKPRGSFSTMGKDLLSQKNSSSSSSSSILDPRNTSTRQSFDITESNKNKNLKNNYHFSSWGRCGLFALTNDSCLSIFANNEKGDLSQMFMFSPFETLTIGKINKQPQKSANITAIAWSDGHLEPKLPKSILAVSSEKGQLSIYDFENIEKITNFKFNDTIISLSWCSFKQNRFYAGSRNGHFYICEISNQKTIEILKVFDFAIKSTSEIIYKSIDYITQDGVNGYTVGIASKDQLFGFITNVNDKEKMNLQLFHNFNINKMSEKINYFEFYPNSEDFVTISTHSSSFFISISKGTLIPFIQSHYCKFISFIDSENDKVIICNDNEISIWQLIDHFFVRIYNMSIGLNEILTFSKLNNKILLTTASNWLTQIEFRRNKIFIIKRIKLIDGNVVDYDFGNGSIAFLTNKNTISLTEPTPESIIKPIFPEKQKQNDESSQKQNSNRFDDNDELDLETFKLKFDESTVGNSNSLVLTFKFENEIFNLKHIRWISPFKIVVWCPSSFYLVDLKLRIITEPFIKKFCKKSVKITQVFFSKSRKLICIVLDHMKAYFLDTKSNLDIIKTIDFSDMIVNETDYLLGSISPNEETAIFSLSNFLYFVNLNEKALSIKKAKSILDFQGTFISWKDPGIFIGTEKGGAVLIPNEKIESIIEKSQFGKKFSTIIFDSINSDKIKLEAIKQILSFSNQRYIIIDYSHKGIIVSKKVKLIAENIKSLKQTSKDNFLVQLQNYNKLIAINSYDDVITSLPPCYFLNQKKKKCFLQEIGNNRINRNSIESILYQLFLTNKTNFSSPFRNSIQLLNEFISTHDCFISVSFKNFLLLGNIKEARNLLLKSNPNDKNYMSNMMLVATYGTNSDSVKLLVENFVKNKLIDDAANVLLMKNDIFAAVDILSKNERSKDAYYILMLNNQIENCDIKEKFILEVAHSLINNKENILLGLKLLSTFGYFQEIINIISSSIGCSTISDQQ